MLLLFLLAKNNCLANEIQGNMLLGSKQMDKNAKAARFILRY